MTLSLAKSVLALIWLLISHAILAAPGSQEAHSRKSQTIYRCRIAGVSTFSDRPCGDTVEQYDAGLSRLSILDSPGVAVHAGDRVAKRASTRDVAAKVSDDKVQAAKAAACQRSQQSLRKIKAQMRAGYSAQQGERLRTRKKDLEEQRRTLGC